MADATTTRDEPDDDKALATSTLRALLRDPKVAPNPKIRAAKLLHDLAIEEECRVFNARELEGLLPPHDWSIRPKA